MSNDLNQYKNKGIIYALVDPRDNSIRYIGKSIQGIYRAKQHSCPSNLKEGNTPKNNWIKKLKGLNLNYQITILFSIDKNSQSKEELNILLYNKEQEFINNFKNITNLLNLTDGGPGVVGRKLSNESRKKSSESHKKRDHTHLRQLAIGQRLSPEKKKLNKQISSKKRNRKIPGAKFKYFISKGKKIIAKDILKNEVIGFYAARMAAKFLGGKSSHTGINKAIINKTIYYGYYWEYV